MDSLFQHSWDYSPYYWDPESYKRRKNSVIPPSLPELSTPREMNEADLTLEASHHKKGLFIYYFLYYFIYYLFIISFIVSFIYFIYCLLFYLHYFISNT